MFKEQFADFRAPLLAYISLLSIFSLLSHARREIRRPDTRTGTPGETRSESQSSRRCARAPRGQFPFIHYEYTHTQRGPPRSRTQLHIHLLHFVLTLSTVYSYTVKCTVHTVLSCLTACRSDLCRRHRPAADESRSSSRLKLR